MVRVAPVNNSPERWFGVRTILRSPPGLYEERVTIWLASDLDDAIALGEAEAIEYAEIVESEYLGLAQAYGPIDDGPVVGAEVFSLMRDSELDADAYLNRFFDTGAERQQHEPRRNTKPRG